MMDIYLAATEDTNIKAKTMDQIIMLENSSMGTFRMNIFLIHVCKWTGLEICGPASFML
jgi:hypothetical protein